MIDLAIVLNSAEEIDKIDLQVQLLLMASDIDTRIEPHPFFFKDFNENNPFTNEILKTGIDLTTNIKIANRQRSIPT